MRVLRLTDFKGNETAEKQAEIATKRKEILENKERIANENLKKRLKRMITITMKYFNVLRNLKKKRSWNYFIS